MYKIKIFALLAIVCLFTVSVAQTKKSRKPRCPKVAKGMVIVGYEGACPVLKPAANGLAICAGSPVPDGYSTFQAGMAQTPESCPGAAFVIYNRNASAPKVTKEDVEALCEKEVEAEIDRNVARNMNAELAAAMAGATRTICMKRNGQ